MTVTELLIIFHVLFSSWRKDLLYIDLTYSVKFQINCNTFFLCLIFDKNLSVQYQSKKLFWFFNV